MTKIRDDYPHIIITGSPADGFEFIGPFVSNSAAVEYVLTDPSLDKGYWWVAPLHAPAEE